MLLRFEEREIGDGFVREIFINPLNVTMIRKVSRGDDRADYHGYQHIHIRIDGFWIEVKDPDGMAMKLIHDAQEELR